MNTNTLQSIGFTPYDHEPHFGAELPGVTYLYRTFGTNHQYVSLISYEGRTVEAVFESYHAPKNTKRGANLKSREAQDKGFAPLAARLYWTEADLVEAVGQTHVLPPKDSKKGA